MHRPIRRAGVGTSLTISDDTRSQRRFFCLSHKIISSADVRDVSCHIHSLPAPSTWRPELALIYSALGHEREARSAFEHLATNDFIDLPQDSLWLTCLAYLAEVCAFLGDAHRAATLY